MTNYLFPLLIVTLFVTALAPVATAWVGDLTTELADETAAHITAAGNF